MQLQCSSQDKPKSFQEQIPDWSPGGRVQGWDGDRRRVPGMTIKDKVKPKRLAVMPAVRKGVFLKSPATILETRRRMSDRLSTNDI